MKNDHEIKAAFDEAFKPGEAEVDQEAVDAACEAVLAKATEQFGKEGIYVFGKLNSDAGGVSFRFKRPSLRLRVEHFIACNVPKPERAEEAQDDDNEGAGSDDAANSDSTDSGSTDERLSRLIELADMLEEDDFTKDGKPEVGALNDLLDDEEAEFTAAERDELWKQVPQD